MPIPSVLLFKHCFSTILPAAVNGGALPIDLVELGSNMITTDGFEDGFICTSELKLGWIWSFIPNLDQNDPNRKVLSALPVFPKGDGLIVSSPNFLFSSVCSPSFCLFLF